MHQVVITLAVCIITTLMAVVARRCMKVRSPLQPRKKMMAVVPPFPLSDVSSFLLEVAGSPGLSEEDAQTIRLACDLITATRRCLPETKDSPFKPRLSEVPNLSPSSLDLIASNSESFRISPEQLGDWSFDIFRFEQKFKENTLAAVFFNTLKNYGLIGDLQLNGPKLMRLISKIEEGYKTANLYHNQLHAADVVQNLGVFLSAPLVQGKLSSLQKLSIFLAGAIHDFDHPGVSNSFLIKIKHPLAILYNDQSPLENHHLTAGLRLFFQDDCNILSHFSKGDQDDARSLMIALVLSTDIALHKTLLSNFNEKASEGKLDVNEPQDLTLLLKMLMKCADTSNAAKPLQLHLKWVERVSEEFFLQGDRERELGLPISLFMDRAHPEIARCQIGFIEFLCAPLYHSVGKQLDRLDIYQHTQDNLMYWKEVEQK